MSKKANRITETQLPVYLLISRTFTVLVTNMIPLYYVLQKGWSSFALILLFITEGVIVFLMDLIKRFFHEQKKVKGVLFFEFVFIFFFGFMAILIFGKSPDSTDLLMTIRSAFQSAKILPLWPVISIFAMRLIRTAQDLHAAGIFGGKRQQQLTYAGGGWMFLLFFLVMLAPFIANHSPNPLSGLVTIVILKTIGEIFEVWATRIK